MYVPGALNVSLSNWIFDATPLAAMHLLWINLITDSLPALALAFDPANKGVMNRKPIKNTKGVFTKGMTWRIVYQGIMIGLITLAAFIVGLATTNTPIEGFAPVFVDACVKRRFDIVNRDEYLDQQIIRMNGVRAHLWGPRDTANGLSEADRKRVESQSSVKAQDYMIEGRNALLIIYFIQPSNKEESR